MRRVLLYAAVALVCLMVLFPAYWMLVTSVPATPHTIPYPHPPLARQPLPGLGGRHAGLPGPVDRRRLRPLPLLVARPLGLRLHPPHHPDASRGPADHPDLHHLPAGRADRHAPRSEEHTSE